MNIDYVIKERCSCRTYKAMELTDLQIREILDAARYAPSPKNRQPWRFVVLRKNSKEDFLRTISDAFFVNPKSYLYESKLNEFNSEKQTYRIMSEADAVILVFNAYPSLEVLGKKDSLFDCTNIQAIGAAIQNMLLKATELKIGSLWICDIFTSYSQICEQYYKEGQLIAAVALGYPAETIKKSPRKSLDELIIKLQKEQMQELIWVGPRESDIYDCKDIFKGSVTIFGSNRNDNISYCAENHIRIDHNIPECVDDSFWINSISKLKKKYPEAKILYYDNEFSFKLTDELKKDVICCNERNLTKMLQDKTAVRKMFSELVPIVPFCELAYSEDLDLHAIFADGKKLIFQENCSSGGYGTHIINIDADKDMKFFIGKTFMVSPYFEKSFSVNLHIVIGKDNILYFPGSIQIIQEIDNKLIYIGADYIAYQTLSVEYKNKLRNYAEQLGICLQKKGYRGIAGFDFLITKKEIMFVEVNARFQASTPLLNMALKKNCLPSIQEIQMTAFSDENLPDQSLIDTVAVPYSMISYVEGIWNKPYEILNNAQEIGEVEIVHKDGFSLQGKIQEGSYLFKIVFNTNCISVNPNYKIDIYENLLDIKDDFFYAILNKEKLEIKISLLNQGVLISDEARKYIDEIGKIRDAVFSAVDLTIFDSLHINCPKCLKFSNFTPWNIDVDENGTLTLFFHDVEISNVMLDMEDIYGNNLIKPDVKFSDVCFWATDRLRIHHNLSCCMKNQGAGCKFCEVLPNDRKIMIEEILDVVDFYLKNANTFRHFLIGGGSEPREIEAHNIIKIVKHIREKSSKNIYVMSLPPENLHVLKDYYEAGVTEIGFNIELYDQDTALNYMPGKGKITRKEYFTALREAVKYWGNTGKVRSLMIVGLETEDSLLQGIQELCKIGVMPILSVFRPIPGTDTENIVPPTNHYLRHIYREGTAICNEFSMNLGPECPACQNNTLSLPFKSVFEK